MCDDISKDELEQLYDRADADTKENGLPTAEKLLAMIEELNATASVTGNETRPGKISRYEKE